MNKLLVELQLAKEIFELMSRNITCIGCKKRPEEISEYVDAARQERPPIRPTHYVIMEEGTFNQFKKNKFYCTPCYIAHGQPLNPSTRPEDWDE